MSWTKQGETNNNFVSLFNLANNSGAQLIVRQPWLVYNIAKLTIKIMTIAQLLLRELEAEIPASRKCVERMKPELYDYKPHEKSMGMGYLSIMIADIPMWIEKTIIDGVIDLATWPKYTAEVMPKLLENFDANVAAAKTALENVSDEALEKEEFILKMGEQVLMQSSKLDSVSSSLNHWVHHRGELVVYMRLNNIAVPSIYGPSADEQGF